MIAIINYEAGNLASVSNALTRIGADFIITEKISDLDSAAGVIFPGVGHARPAMRSLQKNRLDSWLRDTQKPLLGICLGMQLLFESSEEGDAKGLGLIPGRLKKFNSHTEKVPHMGWNTLNKIADHPLLNGLNEQPYFYFVHSYYAPVNGQTLASCQYINNFSAVVGQGNVMGVQFHPEKSGKAGSQLLRNFINMTTSI